MELLNKTMQAVCECGKESRTVTFRNLKNRWPRCPCGHAMKVKSNANTFVHTADRMGDAGQLPEFITRKRSSD